MRGTLDPDGRQGQTILWVLHGFLSRKFAAGLADDVRSAYDEALFERLREWRLARASEDSVPAFVVFTDATLQLIAEHVPTDEKGLRAISGVGPGKIAKYGDEVLALVADRAS